ncbi:MAG: DUF488 family protein [Alphaproteobacteria bacterium]|nr:DUF488 family protein [Alphaproteobacteria bacterium]
MFRIKRIYEPSAETDGFRVLVDRIWPRGMTKEAAAIDLWLKEVAPSTDLRKWFGHEASRWAAFKDRYRAELETPEPAAALETLHRVETEHEVVTILFGARDETRNQAVALLEILNE